MMTHAKLLVFLLFATAVCGGMVVTPAFAAEPAAHWLVNGESLTSSLSFDGSGELLIEDKKTTAGKVAVTCSAIYAGTMNTNGEAEITEVLNLAKEKIGELSGTALLCKSETTCENSTDVEAWPVGLPWRLAAADLGGSFWAVVSATGAEVSCLVLGIKVEDECTDPATSFQLKNVTEGVSFEAPEESGGTCTLGGSEAAVVDTVGAGLLTPTGGGTLSVSE